MSYQHDGQAAEEAARHPLASEQLDTLRDRLAAKRRALGESGVRGHRIDIGTNWGEALPSALRDTTSVSRGDVFDLAATGDWPAVFAASFIWGTGRIGYGPHRYREIVEGTHGRLGEMLTAAAEAAQHDVIAGYAQFYGGHDPKQRAAANAAGWSRIDNFGPAFFTKYLCTTEHCLVTTSKILAMKRPSR